MRANDVDGPANIGAKGAVSVNAVKLLRDVFGNPFHPVTIDLAWLTWREAARRAATEDGGVDATRLIRARAQLDGILGERVRARLAEPALEADTAVLVRAVADHELDPYAAADRALDLLAGRSRVG